MMILPYSVDRKMSGAPYVTYTLLGVNVLLYIVALFMGREAYHEFVLSAGVVPADIRWYSLVTSLFLHGGLMHVGGNMLFLVLFGRHVEDVMGRVWFGLVYLFGGIAAGMLQVVMVAAFEPESGHIPMIGASGAIAALMGVFAVRFYRTKVRVFWLVGLFGLLARAGVLRVSSMIVLGLFGVWELVQGIWQLGMATEAGVGGVAHWAHLGGLFFGIMVAFAGGMHKHGKDQYTLADAYKFFREGDLRRAAECFSQLLRETPDNPDMHLKLAVALDLTHRPSRALAHYGKAVELYACANDPAEAERIFGRVAGQAWVGQHLDPDTILKIGDHQLEQDDFAPAYRTFAVLANGQPGKPQAEVASLRCGDLLLNQLAQPAKALTWYRLVRDRGKVEGNVAAATRSAEAAEQAVARLRARAGK